MGARSERRRNTQARPCRPQSAVQLTATPVLGDGRDEGREHLGHAGDSGRQLPGMASLSGRSKPAGTVRGTQAGRVEDIA